MRPSALRRSDNPNMPSPLTSATSATSATPAELAAPSPPGLRPHQPLPAYYGDEADHQRFLRHIFDDTAADYERIERVLAFGSGPSYRRRALQRAGLASGMQVLDVGIGTGLVAREAMRLIGAGGELVGVDPSAGMMAQVHLPGIRLVQGRAEALPLDNASADFLSMGYALRHISDVDAALAEFWRVLRPGGRVMMLEITRPAGRLATAALKGYMRMVVPVIARLVSRQTDTARLWRYYWDTIEACIAPPTVLEAMRRAGFAEAQRHVELGMFSEYTAQKPA